MIASGFEQERLSIGALSTSAGPSSAASGINFTASIRPETQHAVQIHVYCMPSPTLICSRSLRAVMLHHRFKVAGKSNGRIYAKKEVEIDRMNRCTFCRSFRYEYLVWCAIVPQQRTTGWKWRSSAFNRCTPVHWICVHMFHALITSASAK